MYTADGNRFYVKGIAPPPSSTTSPTPPAARELLFLQQLGLYECVEWGGDLSYTRSDTPTQRLDRHRPPDLLDQYIKTINVLPKYDVLAYNVGNEVLASGATNATPFITAAARDVKASLASIQFSAQVGYADIDGAPSSATPPAMILEGGGARANAAPFRPTLPLPCRLHGREVAVSSCSSAFVLPWPVAGSKASPGANASRGFSSESATSHNPIPVLLPSLFFHCLTGSCD
ncbi:hypothetical protein C8R45DRAFT_1102775 [Mycena sanguinolenta]|nr:hypothetical protein C8R45DRAFT_1102775 [Mycena sanguinolenta]